MSRDIRSFFNVISKKPAPTEPNIPNAKKRSIADVDDIIPGTPELQPKKKNKSSDKSESKRRRIITLSSDSETENDKSKASPSKSKKLSSNSKKSSKNHKTNSKISPKRQKETVAISSDSETENATSSKIQKVSTNGNKKSPKKKDITPKKEEKQVTKKKFNIFEAFGSKPVKQDKIPKKPKSELNIHDDDEFDKTLIDLDVDDLLQKAESSEKKEEKSSKTSISSDDSSNKKISKMSVSSDDSIMSPIKNTSKKITPTKSSSEKEKKTPSRKRKSNEDDDEEPTMDPDEARYEKRRQSAALYKKYLNRSGPAHPGSKWIPKGKPNCLDGLTFIITGELDSMQRDEAQALIIEHGGRCVKSVSGKTNYMVLGEDAGPSKVEKARKLSVKIISEDDLIDLICIKSKIKNENITKTENNTSKQSSTSETDEKIETPKKKSSTTIGKIAEKYKTIDNKITVEKEKNLEKSEKRKTPIKEKPKKEIVSDDEDDEIPAVTIKPEVKPAEKIVPKTETQISKPKIEKKIDEGSLAWVDKYKPDDITKIIGQQGEKSNMNKLIKWLKNWDRNREREASKKGAPKNTDDDGGYFRCALLSGPPGVGKTTTATLVCKHLGLDTVEFNASDTRNKRMIHDEVAHILKTTSLSSFFAGDGKPTKHHVLLMDEVDGMSGNEDRGGIQELISLIKTTQVPIICMCNDRQHPKIRTLANYCFDLKFAKPKLEQIRGPMMSICFKEGLNVSPAAIAQIIQGTGQDVRQSFNQLALLAAGTQTDPEIVAQQAKSSQKDTRLGPWEVIRKVFSEEEHKTMSFMDHSKLFFYDYSIGPLFVQENYLKVVPHCPKSEHLRRFAEAADSISMGDVIDCKIRSTQTWSLLDLQAMYASVIPGHLLRGHMGGMIDFPSWLGKNSKATKFQRLAQEIYAHTRMSTSCDRTSLNLDMVQPLRDAITFPLLQDGAEGIPQAMEAMKAYNLVRNDFASLVELAQWSKVPDPFAKVDPKVKAAFTRAYNKYAPPLPYAVTSGPVKKRAVANTEDMYGEEDDAIESEEETNDDDFTADVKIKKPATSKAAGSSKPSSTQSNTSAKGKRKPKNTK